MIAGGSEYNGHEQSAYILNIYFDDINPAKIVNVSHLSLPRIPFKYTSGFSEFCQGRLIIGGGEWSNGLAELDGIDFMDDLPSTKIQRAHAASVYHSGYHLERCYRYFNKTIFLMYSILGLKIWICNEINQIFLRVRAYCE